MSTNPSMADLKLALQARVRDVVHWLAPGGKEVHGHYAALNPTRADKNPGSFVIWLNGTAIGAWREYAGGEDEKGDIIDLVQYCLRLPDRTAAYRAALEFLGGYRQPLSTREIDRAKRQQAAAERDAARREERGIADERKRAHGWWVSAGELAGTLGETYLAARGIDLSKLTRPPGAVRYSSHLLHRPSGQHFPGLMSLMTGPDNRPVAVHRTFLARDGSDKAPVKPPRMIWPRGWAGGKVPIARGASDKAERQASEAGETSGLVLTEGIEDALTIAMAAPEHRVWAVGTLGNLAHITVPPCASEVIVAADNDWTKKQAQKALDQGRAALEAQGVPVSVVFSFLGKDMNDLVRA